VDRPDKELNGFQLAPLQPGQTETVTVTPAGRPTGVLEYHQQELGGGERQDRTHGRRFVGGFKVGLNHSLDAGMRLDNSA
jgi:hypothetical protein